MNCQDIARILDEREVDSLLAQEKSDAQAHLDTCSDCARDWKIHVQLLNARIPEVPVALRAQYSQRAGKGFSRHGRNRFVVVGTFITVAAASAVLVFRMTASHTPVAAIVVPPQVDPLVVEEPSVMQALREVLPVLTDFRSEHESKAVEEWMQRVTDWLAVRDDPDALIAAAMLLQDPKPDARRIHSLLQRATAMAPDSARINAAAMLLCQALQPCDTMPYEQALRRVAPDNALGWSGEVYRASQAGDQEALRNALAAMARARTFDFYWNPSITAMVAQISAARVAPPDIKGGSSPEIKHVVAVGAFTALPIPAYSPITKFCKSATDENVLLDCHQIGAAMAAGDTVFANLIGLTISASGLPADSAEARSLKQQERQIRWINSHGILTADDPRFPVSVAEHPREIDTLRAFLEERGIPTEPPADWKR